MSFTQALFGRDAIVYWMLLIGIALALFGLCAMVYHAIKREWADLGVRFLYFFLGASLVVVAPNFHRPHHGPGPLTRCKSNLKNLGTALEFYSSDYAGHYPPSMSLLTPNYLKVMLPCPSARRNTYSRSYRRSVLPDAYTFYCEGTHHTAAGITTANYPQYNSSQGMVERP